MRGYVRVLEDQKFHDHGTFITLPRGSVLERLEPNERDARAFAEQRKRDGRQLVVVQWKNDTVWLYANTIEEATLTDWECQREM